MWHHKDVWKYVFYCKLSEKWSKLWKGRIDLTYFWRGSQTDQMHTLLWKKLIKWIKIVCNMAPYDRLFSVHQFIWSYFLAKDIPFYPRKTWTWFTGTPWSLQLERFWSEWAQLSRCRSAKHASRSHWPIPVPLMLPCHSLIIAKHRSQEWAEADGETDVGTCCRTNWTYSKICSTPIPAS